MCLCFIELLLLLSVRRLRCRRRRRALVSACDTIVFAHMHVAQPHRETDRSVRTHTQTYTCTHAHTQHKHTHACACVIVLGACARSVFTAVVFAFCVSPSCTVPVVGRFSRFVHARLSNGTVKARIRCCRSCVVVVVDIVALCARCVRSPSCDQPKYKRDQHVRNSVIGWLGGQLPSISNSFSPGASLTQAHTHTDTKRTHTLAPCPCPFAYSNQGLRITCDERRPMRVCSASAATRTMSTAVHAGTAPQTCGAHRWDYDVPRTLLQ